VSNRHKITGYQPKGAIMSKYNLQIEGISVEAVFNKLGGVEGARRFLCDELVISESTNLWREENGAIFFSVTSNGLTGEEWITRLESKGFRVSDYAKQLLRSSDFKPTFGGNTEIAILKGELFRDNKRVTKIIRAEAGKRKLGKPNAEVACLIREKFTDEEIKKMGLIWLITMHDPIKDADGDPRLLGVSRNGDENWLSAHYDGPGGGWDRDDGFVFVC